jgi:hypothetical protein
VLLFGDESTSDSSGLFVSEVEGEVCVFERVECECERATAIERKDS